MYWRVCLSVTRRWKLGHPLWFFSMQAWLLLPLSRIFPCGILFLLLTLFGLQILMKEYVSLEATRSGCIVTFFPRAFIFLWTRMWRRYWFTIGFLFASTLPLQ